MYLARTRSGKGWTILGALLLAGLLAACQTGVAPTATAPATSTTAAKTVEPGPTATVCSAVQVPPKLIEVQPSQAAPGDALKVIGSGGYSQDSCGGVNESARTFALYLDRQPLGDLSCYVDHCEAALHLPADTAPGAHCISLEVGHCDLQLKVVAR